MIVVRNSIIPFEGFKALTVWPFIFVREEADMSDVDMNHERIHGRQQVEKWAKPLWEKIWYSFFWIAVFIAWLGHKFYNNMKK